MTHARLSPCNGRVAIKGWPGQADRHVDGVRRQIAVPVADLYRAPDGVLDCQLLYGANFTVLEDRHGWSFGQATGDDYVGYIPSEQLRQVVLASHKVTALASHVYCAPDMKSATSTALPFGAALTGTCTAGFLALKGGGFVPAQHVQPLGHVEPDFVTQLARFLGIPYLWGGNSVWGMDCSGALQLALHSVGLECPRDTDMQIASLGKALPDNAPLARGDLIFWRGHVGVMLDGETLIHANAHHMAVAIEPLAGVITRIGDAGGGLVTARKRITLGKYSEDC